MKQIFLLLAILFFHANATLPFSTDSLRMMQDEDNESIPDEDNESIHEPVSHMNPRQSWDKMNKDFTEEAARIKEQAKKTLKAAA